MQENKFTLGSASNHYLTSLCELAKKKQLNIDRLLRACKINPASVNKPGFRIHTEKLSMLQCLVWRALGDESSQMCGIPMRLGSYELMGQLTVHQPTLKLALEKGLAFYNLIITKQFLALDFDGQNAILTVNLPHPECDYKHLFAEMTLLAWHRYSSWLIASTIPLSLVKFNYPPPAHVHEYHYLYPGEHQFNCDELSITFPAQYLSKPVKQNEGSLSSFIRSCPLELFRQYKSDYSLTSSVKHLLINDIENGRLTLESAASALHITSRTLMRRLNDEGTCYQQIKDAVRRDKAVMMLTQQTTPINVIAESVGFADPAAFTRAFKIWTGETPRKFREIHSVENV